MTNRSGHPEPGDGAAGVTATVVANLANGMFCLQTTDGREVLAHVAQNLRMALTRLLPGDRVLIERSPFDPNKARICRLLASSRPSQHETPTEPPQQRELS